MRVVLELSLFSDASVDPASLLQLILACRRPSPHFAVLSPRWQPAVDVWLAQWPTQVRRAIDGVLRDSVESARRPNALTVVVQPGGSRWREDPRRGPRVGVDDALALTRGPLHVLVENRRNDGRFLARFAIALPYAQRALFEEAVKRGWIMFEQGGGLSEVKCLLDDLDAPSMDPVLCPAGARREVRRWRLAVVVDRDSFEIKRPKSLPKAQWSAPPRDPTRPSKESKAVVDRGVLLLPNWEARAGVHQLQRRAIENYLPLRTLSAWIDLGTTPTEKTARRAKINALAALDAPAADGSRARWYFGMKDGLDGDRPAGFKGKALADTHIHELFHELSPPQRLAIHGGFNTRDESIADLLFDRTMTPDEWLREELTLGGAREAADLLLNLLNRM